MLTIDKTSVMSLENALRGARNPMNSWENSDSYYSDKGTYVLGENDLTLAQKLCRAGSDHRKFIRQIIVSVDITAPLYWWKEFDTYKVATVTNSTSTMHKIHSKTFELDDFSHDQLTTDSKDQLISLIHYLEKLRIQYNNNKDKKCWNGMRYVIGSAHFLMVLN